MKLFNKKDEIKEVETVVDEEGNVVEVEEKKKPSFKEWVENHKKGLAIGAVGLTALAAGIGMAIKNHKKNDAGEDDLYYDEDDEDEDDTDDDSDKENESEESTED